MAGRIAANGLHFAYDEAGVGDSVALCLHGFPEARQAWADQLPALAALGWRAVAVDMRGYGDSDRPQGRDAYRLQNLADDVEALFTAFGAKRRILIAHDWGGIVAWWVAMTRPGLLDGLVILNAPHPARYREVLNRGLRQRLRSWYVLYFLLPRLPEVQLRCRGRFGVAQVLRRQSPNFPPERLAIYQRNIEQPFAATAMVDYYRANALPLGFGRLPAEPVTTPTLLIWGEADFALDLALTEGLDRHVTDLTLRRLPGVSHWVQEDASGQVNNLIVEWARDRALASR